MVLELGLDLLLIKLAASAAHSLAVELLARSLVLLRQVHCAVPVVRVEHIILSMLIAVAQILSMAFTLQYYFQILKYLLFIANECLKYM